MMHHIDNYLAILGMIYIVVFYDPNDGRLVKRGEWRSLVAIGGPLFSTRARNLASSQQLVERNGERIIYASLLLWL